MPHPIQIIYEPYYRKFITIFTENLPYVYYDYKVGDNEDELHQIQLDFKECIKLHTDGIYIATSDKINTYLNDFSVMPRGTIDEFKIIFFLAKTLAKRLEKDGLHNVAKITLLIMIYLLDYRLNDVKAHRPKLTKQSVKMINNNILLDKTGEVGLYLTYKCLYNYAQDKST